MMKQRVWISSLVRCSLIAALSLTVACGTIRSHRQIDQPLGSQLTTGIGGTVFRLNKSSDLPNVFGGRGIYGGKGDRRFGGIKLGGIEGPAPFLNVRPVTRQTSGTGMGRL